VCCLVLLNWVTRGYFLETAERTVLTRWSVTPLHITENDGSPRGTDCWHGRAGRSNWIYRPASHTAGGSSTCAYACKRVTDCFVRNEESAWERARFYSNEIIVIQRVIERFPVRHPLTTHMHTYGRTRSRMQYFDFMQALRTEAPLYPDSNGGTVMNNSLAPGTETYWKGITRAYSQHAQSLHCSTRTNRTLLQCMTCTHTYQAEDFSKGPGVLQSAQGTNAGKVCVCVRR